MTTLAEREAVKPGKITPDDTGRLNQLAPVTEADQLNKPPVVPKFICWEADAGSPSLYVKESEAAAIVKSEGGESTCKVTGMLNGTGFAPSGVTTSVSVYMPTGSVVGLTATLIETGKRPLGGVTVSHWLTGGETVTEFTTEVTPVIVAIAIDCAAGKVVAFVN